MALFVIIKRQFKGKTYFFKTIPKNEANDFLSVHHYARNKPVTMFSIGVFIQENGELRLIGVISYGKSASPKVYPAIAEGLKQNEYLELIRLCVLDETPSNFESWFISFSFQLVMKHYPEVRILISFADPYQGHEGTIYQATNWIYAGTTSKSTSYRNLITGKEKHPRSYHKLRKKGETDKLNQYEPFKKPGKHRYLYILRKSKIYYRDTQDDVFFDETELEYYENLEYMYGEEIIERVNGHYKKHYRYIKDDLKYSSLPYPKSI